MILSKTQTRNIRLLYLNGYSAVFIAKKYKVNSMIIRYRIFDLVKPIALIENDKRLKVGKFNKKEIIDIRNDFKNGKTVKEISVERKIIYSTVFGIINGRTYRWIKGETKSGLIIPKKEKPTRRLCDMPLGAKKNTKHKVKRGGLTYLMQKYNISRSSAWLWVKNNKVQLPEIFIKC